MKVRNGRQFPISKGGGINGSLFLSKKQKQLRSWKQRTPGSHLTCNLLSNLVLICLQSSVWLIIWWIHNHHPLILHSPWLLSCMSRCWDGVNDDVKWLVADVNHQLLCSAVTSFPSSFPFPTAEYDDHCQRSFSPPNNPLQLHLVITPLFCSSSPCKSNAGSLTALYKQWWLGNHFCLLTEDRMCSWYVALVFIISFVV